jgi:glycosyltransferase involved in cell wall biosynthesis
VFSDVPFFSIILPTFDRAHLVKRAIESVLDQTYSDWELIVVDDGSTDNTFATVRPIVLTDARLRYHFAANRGLAGARNIGLALAGGEYITFLDSDDLYRPDHLQLRAERLASGGSIELMHGGVEVIGPDMVADKHDPSRMIPLAECVIGGTFVIKRELAVRLGGFRGSYGDDRDFFDRAEQSGARIVTVDWPTYVYNRLEPDSLCAIVEREGVEGIERYRHRDTQNHD